MKTSAERMEEVDLATVSFVQGGLYGATSLLTMLRTVRRIAREWREDQGQSSLFGDEQKED